jgi:hypothetical protein
MAGVVHLSSLLFLDWEYHGPWNSDKSDVPCHSSIRRGLCYHCSVFSLDAANRPRPGCATQPADAAPHGMVAAHPGFFNLFWQYVVAVRLTDSLRNEFRDRLRDDGSDYGKSLGMTQTILLIVSIGPLVATSVDEVLALLILGVVQLVAFVLFVSFWVKIAIYSRELAVVLDRVELDRRLAKFDHFDDDDQDVPKAVAPKPSPGTCKERDPGRYQ